MEASDIELHRELGRNFVLSGGNTSFDGLNIRLNAEILTLAPAGAEIRFLYSTDRKFAAWGGASTFASLSTMNSFWFNARDFGEFGPERIHRYVA